jgi:4-hydroxybenzoate adenylyltransferase
VNAAAQLAELAARRGWNDRPAFHTRERSFSHGEVHDIAARLASVLAERGVDPDRPVLIALPDGIEWVVSFLAVARLGALAVTVNPDLPEQDHQLMLEKTEASLVLCAAELAGHFSGADVLEGSELLPLARGRAWRAPQPVLPEAPLYAQFTSGTTGEPKAAVHCHSHLEGYYRAVGERALEIRPSDVALSISKLYFAYGFGNAFVFPLFSGSSAVLVEERPAPDQVEALVARHLVSILYAVPSAYARLLDASDASPYSSVRAAISAGEPLRTALAVRINELLGAPVLEQLGSTEAGHAFCANSVATNEPGTVGRPTAGYRVELRDSEGQPVAPGLQGEMFVSGPTLMREYLNLPGATAEVVRDGWLRTHDLAVCRPSGAYEHCGRTDDMEMVGGITVSPLEIERVLGEHPAVADVGVASVVNGEGASSLHAYVVTPLGASERAGLRDQLASLARERLAAFKVPREIHVVEQLPRTATGKLRRFVLRRGAV